MTHPRGSRGVTVHTGTRVAVFGSRLTGAVRCFSDLDVAVMVEDPIPSAVLANLREELDESDLPFKVDIVEWASRSESFWNVIERDAVPLTPSSIG